MFRTGLIHFGPQNLVLLRWTSWPSDTLSPKSDTLALFILVKFWWQNDHSPAFYKKTVNWVHWWHPSLKAVNTRGKTQRIKDRFIILSQIYRPSAHGYLARKWWILPRGNPCEPRQIPPRHLCTLGRVPRALRGGMNSWIDELRLERLGPRDIRIALYLTPVRLYVFW